MGSNEGEQCGILHYTKTYAKILRQGKSCSHNAPLDILYGKSLK